MPETLCKRCGAELAANSHCELCGMPVNFACAACGYVSDDRVHADCATALLFARA